MLLQNGLLPATRRRIVADETEEDRIHLIGTPLAEQALQAFRNVSQSESGFQVDTFHYFAIKSVIR